MTIPDAMARLVAAAAYAAAAFLTFLCFAGVFAALRVIY